jgi:hypothetical protein
MLQAGRSGVRVLMRLLNFVNLLNRSSYTVAQGFTQPPTEMSIISRKEMLLGSRAQPAHKAYMFTAIC